MDEKFLLEELTAKYEFSKQSESSPKVRIPEDLSSTIEDTWSVEDLKQ